MQSLGLGLLSVWLLAFGIVHSELPPENVFESEVDVKNLMERLVVLEESLKAEKQRNDHLERTVSSLVTELDQTKRTFEDKYLALEMQLQEHLDFKTNDLSCTNKNIVNKTQKRIIPDDKQRKRGVSWLKPKKSELTNQYSIKPPDVERREHSAKLQRRLLQVPVTPSTVVFFAQMSSNIPASEATGNHVMVFDVVKTNAGNGYHPTTGVFIVPESGIYVFSWSFRNGDNHYHSTELVVNNSIESVIHLHAGAGNWLSGTGVAVLHVNKGDDVYVRISSLSHYCLTSRRQAI